MSLLLSTTWEHALLARVIKEGAEVAQIEGGYVGRTAIQKIMYFLQVMDVPMRYRFDVHHFGPFCNKILADTEWLLADEVIAESSTDRSKYSNYVPYKACEELLSEYSAKLNQHDDIVRSVVKALLPLDPEHLELIATLDYAFRDVKATVGGKPQRSEVIARFRDFKGDKFKSEEIDSTFNQLEKAGLFE